MVPAEAMQILWCGIEVPETAEGQYLGSAMIEAGPNTSGRVDITLNVTGDPVEDHGDNVAKNLSRLRWLDSAVGSEPTITSPFTPVKTKGREISVLGRTLALNENDLPAQITSFLNSANTGITDAGRPVLAAPFSFVVEPQKGAVKWETSFGTLEYDELEAR